MQSKIRIFLIAECGSNIIICFFPTCLEPSRVLRVIYRRRIFLSLCQYILHWSMQVTERIKKISAIRQLIWFFATFSELNKNCSAINKKNWAYVWSLALKKKSICFYEYHQALIVLKMENAIKWQVLASLLHQPLNSII